MWKTFPVLSALILIHGCSGLPTRHPASDQAARAFLLRYKFRPAHELRYILRSTSSSHTLGEDPKALSVNQEVEFRQNALEILPDGKARIAVIIDKLRFVMSRPGREVVVFDSEEGEGLAACPQEMRGIAFLLGKEIEIAQAPCGEVEGISGLKSIYTKALTRLSLQERQPAERLLRQMAYRPSGLLGLDVIFPSRAVAVGEGWPAEKGPFPVFCGGLAYRCHYVLKRVADRRAAVEFSGESGGDESRPGSKIRQVRKVRVRGSFSFDLEKGILTGMQGQSSSFLRVGESEQLPTRTRWELTLHNEAQAGAAGDQAHNASRQ